MSEPKGNIFVPTRVDIMVAAISDGISTVSATLHRAVLRSTVMLALLHAVLTGCATAPTGIVVGYSPGVQQELLKQALGGPQDLIVPVDILEFGSELKQYVDSHIDRSWAPQRRLRGLRKMLFGSENLNIQYDSTKTRTAIETFETKL